MAANFPPAGGGRDDDRYCPRCAMHYRRSPTGDDHQMREEWRRGHVALPHVKCNSCSHEYVLEHVNSHRVVHHPYQCGHCNFRFLTFATTRSHEQAAHPRYVCMLCDSHHICFGHQAICGHVQSVHPGHSVHPCRQCQQIFCSEANQRRHVAMVVRHCCDICGDHGISFHSNMAL